MASPPGFSVIGWGRTSEGGSLPGLLQHVNVPVLTLDQCRNMKYRASRITPNMVSFCSFPEHTIETLEVYFVKRI